MTNDDELKKVFDGAKSIGRIAPIAMLAIGLILVVVLVPKMMQSPEWRTPVPVAGGVLFILLGTVGVFYSFVAARTDRELDLPADELAKLSPRHLIERPANAIINLARLSLCLDLLMWIGFNMICLSGNVDWLRQKEFMSDTSVIVGIANGIPLWRMFLDWVCLWRANCAKQLRGNFLNVLIFVFATIPLFGPCIVLSIPFAIQLVRIMKLPHVKAAMDRRA